LDAVLAIPELTTSLERGDSLDERIDAAFALMEPMGFNALIYDYTPVPFRPDGTMISPSLLCLRHAPEDMHELWCRRGYYLIDPAQQVAARSITPFIWCYRQDSDTVINRIMSEAHTPVVRYLHDTDMTCGVSVPIHMPRGDYATVTAVRFHAERDFERAAQETVADFALLAHVFHAAAMPLYDEDALVCHAARVTARERQCLKLSAEGLTAKEIARRLDRSVATVVLHLNSAARRLGARNRVHAVTLAAHYRLLDD